MCLGAQQRAANERARRDYQYKLDKRKADWMQTLSLTKAEHVQYKQSIEASNLALAGAYGEMESKHKELVGQVYQANEASWKEFLQKNTGGELEAAGRTGRSIKRASTLDLAGYLRQESRRAYQLTQATAKLSEAAAQAAGKSRAEQMQLFANVAFEKHPDLAPPKPVMQSVVGGAFMDALQIGASIAAIPATGGASGGSALLKALNLQ